MEMNFFATYSPIINKLPLRKSTSFHANGTTSSTNKTLRVGVGTDEIPRADFHIL